MCGESSSKTGREEEFGDVGVTVASRKSLYYLMKGVCSLRFTRYHCHIFPAQFRKTS